MPVQTTNNIRIDINTDGIPAAHEEYHPNPEQVPFAKQLFDTKKLYRRWGKCCEIALRIAHIGLQHADNLHTEATISGTFGLLFGSKTLQNHASRTNERAHETAKFTLIFAAGFLAISILATTLFWAVEEGLIGTIVKSITAAANSLVGAVKGLFNRVFRRSDKTSTQELNSPTPKEHEKVTLDQAPVKEAIAVNPLSPKTFLPSGFKATVCEAPTATVCEVPEDVILGDDNYHRPGITLKT